jgi:hypothetical protein
VVVYFDIYLLRQPIFLKSPLDRSYPVGESTLLGYDVALYIHSALLLVPSSNSVPVIPTWPPPARALATIELVAFDISLASEILTS